uniref:Pheophorbide a oxygenase domain-containing protein n=1 Tax=Setaria viridis TaxID=4556 RepID=A0A4U6SRR0_SETVI|nr:hypothetical protein SEVIR_9G046400v2 [Setaria viridis]
MFTNRIFDSDMYLLHIEEHNFAAVGLDNWHQACYVPTSSDGMVIAFRNWFRRHCKNQIVWATPQVDQLPSIKTKDKLLDRTSTLRIMSMLTSNKFSPPYMHVSY